MNIINLRSLSNRQKPMGGTGSGNEEGYYVNNANDDRSWH
jgi:hypothetical protein